MKSLLITVALLLVAISSSLASDVDSKQVKCLVCRTVMDEFLHRVKKIDPRKKISIGEYRLDAQGNIVQKEIPLASSEIHLGDMFEEVCKVMDDYVRARYKTSGKLTLIKLVTEDGLNPIMSEVDVVQDGDLNKSLMNYCDEITNEHVDNTIELVKNRKRNVKSTICTQMSGYCQKLPEGFDDDEEEDEETVVEDADYTIESDKTEL